MAVEVEAAGQVDEFVRVLKRRMWWIIVPVVVFGSLGTFFAVVVPKKYVTEMKVMVGNPASAGIETPGSTEEQGVVAKFSIGSPERVRSVLDQLKWDGYELKALKEKREFIAAVRRELRVKTPAMDRRARQQLVEISFKSDSAEKAHRFVTDLFQSWKSEVLDAQKNAAENERDETKKLLDDQRKELARKAQDVEDERTKWNIPPPRARGEAGYEQSISPVFDESTRLAQRIVELEDEIDKARSEVERKRTVWARMPLEAPAEVVAADPSQNGVDRLQEQIDALELQQRTSGLHPRHSTYRRRENQIDELREALKELKATTSTARLEPDATVENPARLALWEEILKDEDAIEQLEADLTRVKEREADASGRAFQLNVAYSKIDQLISEIRELEARITVQAQQYDKAKRLVSRLSDSEGENFEIIQKPEVPLEPTDPNPWIIAIGSIIASLGVGLGLAVLKEYAKSVFRTPREVARVMPHPVLGRINTIRTRRERARTFLVQATLAGSSLAFLFSVVYVTVAYGVYEGEGLTEPLLDAIEAFREMLA